MKNALFRLCILYAAIIYYNRRRNNAKVTRSALLGPKFAPWYRLLNFGDDLSFLTLTGLTRFAFMELEAAVSHGLPERTGRPPQLDFRGQLGLYLFFLGSRMPLKHLCMLFGVVPSTASVFINRFIRLVPRKLRRNDRAAVRFPSPERMAELARLVQQREPLATNIIGFADGLALPVQCSSDDHEQSVHYNGLHHDTTVNNVLLFLADGMVGFACLNYPGSWHDAQVSMSLIKTVLDRIGTYAVCVDQGFPRGGDLFGIFVGPLSKRARRNLAPALAPVMLQKHAVYVSLRQAAEWGMRALQGTFARMSSRLTSNKEKRGLILQGIVLLHNFRTSYIGLNQIRKVFDPEYEQYINLDGYDRIARYFL